MRTPSARVLALEQVAGEVVELSQAGALAVGQQQLDVGERALELLLDALAQLVHALPGERADQDGVGMAQADVEAALRRRARRPC